jgi:hypothetical protein
MPHVPYSFADEVVAHFEVIEADVAHAVRVI